MNFDDTELDAELDRRLKAVTTPREFLARLAAIADPDAAGDAILDRSLADVVVPAGLDERLCALASEAVAADDAALDVVLRDVAVPRGLKPGLRRIPARRARFVGSFAAAALFALVAAWQWLPQLRAPSTQNPLAVQPAVDDSPVLSLRERLAAAGDLRFAPPSEPIVPQPAVINTVDVALASEQARLERSVFNMLASQRRGPDVFHQTAWAMGRPTAGVSGILGAPPRDDLPDVVRPALRAARGVDVPLGADDRKFLLDYGVFPRVTPREFPTSVVPLVNDTTGYEEARAALAAGQWPDAAQMRAEEFLAAVEFGYGRPTDAAARVIAAGALAPWNPPSVMAPPLPGRPAAPPEQIARLLQVSVQARELPAAKRPATYLTVAVDLTTSMRAGGRLAMVKSALVALANRLGGGDRITLVALGGANPVVVEEAGRAELEQLLAAIDWLAAGGAGSLSSGTLTACAAAARRELPRSVERRVVIVSDAFSEFDPKGVRTVERFLQTSAARGLKLDLIDVSRENEESAWSEMVRRRDGRMFRGDTTERIRSALMEALTGRGQVVASEAVLTIEFNPQSVASYRLIGHEPTALAGLLPRRVEVDLHAGQAATMLYEVQLTGGKVQDVATATLRWRDPSDGAPREAVQKITRSTLATEFAKASPQLQLAVVAASAAAHLRQSPWGDNVAPEVVLQWARRLQGLGTVRGVEPWIKLVDQARKLPPPRRR